MSEFILKGQRYPHFSLDVNLIRAKKYWRLVCCLVPLIPVLRRLKRKDYCEFKTSLGDIVRLYLKKDKIRKKG